MAAILSIHPYPCLDEGAVHTPFCGVVQTQFIWYSLLLTHSHEDFGPKPGI